MADKGSDTKVKTEKAMVKKNVGLQSRNEKQVKEKDEDLKKKNEKSMKEKNDDAANKSKKAMIIQDDCKKEKTEKSMTIKNNGLDETGKSITDKSNVSLNKNEKEMTEEDCGSLDESKKAKDEGSKYDEEQTTASNLKKCIHSVKVSKRDASIVQRELEGETFNRFSESWEITKATKIRFEKLNAYLDHLKEGYEGINDNVRTKINSKIFIDKSWDFKMVEWNFKRPDNSGIIYGFLALGRSKDQEYVDSMYVSYKMDFEVSPHEIVKEETHSLFRGFYKYTTQKVVSVENSQDTDKIPNMENFFRVKVLERIFKEGFIESINCDDSKDETQDSNCD